LDEDKVSTEQIDNAVRLILDTKYDLGLFQDPINIVMKTERKLKYSQDHRAEARKIASQSLVLLKTKTNCFLLKKRNYRSYRSFG
jgi:beta-glucosidase